MQYTTWKWILRITGIMCLALAGFGFVMIPPSAPRRDKPSWRRLDMGGVSIITAAIILFVYAVTSGPIDGWGSANCLAPLVISIVLSVAFFVYEAKIPEDSAALPPKVWNYPNVGVLMGVACNPFFWLSSRA